MRALVVVGVLVLAAALSGGCDMNGTPCYPGDSLPCSCPGGASGLAVCAANGGGYGACSCVDAGNVIDAEVDVGDAGSGLPFGATCAQPGDCASGVCFVGGMRSFCSLHCKTPQDCPVPPTIGVCNNKDYCKAP
jgi:hypothetical protein